MRKRNPQDNELLNWAEFHSSTVTVEHWPGDKYGKVDLILIPSHSLADVTHHCLGILEPVRLALLEQYFIEHEGSPDA